MSGGGKEVTSGTTEPWAAAQPALKMGLKDAENIYKSGTSFAPYTGSTVVPFSDQTRAGMQGIQNQSAQAMSDGTMGKPLGFYGSMFDNGGLSADQQGVANQWRTTASGSEMGGSNPYFEDVLRRSLEDTATSTNLGMSGAGRYGSGMHTDTLADRTGRQATEARMGEYQNQQGRMDNARSSLAGLGQQGITNQFGAAQAMPGAWENSQRPAMDLIKIGGMYEDLAGRTMGDQLRIFEETQNAQRAPLEWLNSIASGAGSLGNTQRQVQPGTNPFVQALGYGLGANNLLDNPLGKWMGA